MILFGGRENRLSRPYRKLIVGLPVLRSVMILLCESVFLITRKRAERRILRAEKRKNLGNQRWSRLDRLRNSARLTFLSAFFVLGSSSNNFPYTYNSRS